MASEKNASGAFAAACVSRRRALGVIGATLSNPSWAGRTFELRWTEEVQLANGAVILISLRYTYESLSLFDKFGSAILRRTDLQFDAGPRLGVFSQSFDHHRVDMIQPDGERWFVVLETRGGPPYETLPNGKRQQIWGPPENIAGQKCWVLDARGFTRASILDIPEPLLAQNILMDYAPVRDLAGLDGKRVTLAMKADITARNPVSPPAGSIIRPPVPKQR